MTNDNHDIDTTSEADKQAYENKVNETTAFIADILSADEYDPAFIDPKGNGDLDVQDLDIPNLVPVDVDQLNSDGNDNGAIQ